MEEVLYQIPTRPMTQDFLMLEIQNVEWRNFMSYGDYDNFLDLSSLGQCLVTGEVIGSDKDVFSDSIVAEKKKSNGAGKSTIPNVILWTLFGRTMHSYSPGDKIVNWFTGKDCRCKITFKSGDEIIRTRNTSGKNELIYTRNGDMHTLTSDTLSTAKAQQAELNRAFNLDWDLFCGSVFFNQYSKPWMEMADQTRKKAIERALHVDRFSYYSKIAKGKCDKIDTEVQNARDQIQIVNDEITRLTAEITRIAESSRGFETKQRERQAEALRNAVLEKQKRDGIDLPDIDQLKKKWSIIDQIKKRIRDMENEVTLLNRQIASFEGMETSLKQRIKTWVVKSGKICGACEQDVPKSHTDTKIKPIQAELDQTSAELDTKKSELQSLTEKIVQVRQLLQEKAPDQTIFEADEIHKQWKRHDGEITRLKKLAESIMQEENPHEKTLADVKNRIDQRKAKLPKLEKEIERIDYLNTHYGYIYKAWNDRGKIKSFVFQDHIPFINSRLKHYLDVFGLDVQIELTTALGITSNMWGYQFESGGERKRTDVAFMLAMFDFHEEMYGRQCNVLVLDEVDGRLDDDGIDSLINVIKNDLAPKVETIIVISHRNLMYDTFPTEIHVKRLGAVDFRGFSQLEAA